MHPVQLTGIGKVTQIAADGLQGNAEPLGKAFYGDTSLKPCNFQNLTLSKAQRQAMFLLNHMVTHN